MSAQKHGSDVGINSITETVEMMKIAFRQDNKDGFVMCFAIDPQSLPEHLFLAPINTRFMAALVRLDDNEQPVPKSGPAQKEKKRQNANVMRAAIACGEVEFQRFLQRRYNKAWRGALGEGTAQAADTLRAILKIDSRKELASNVEALNGFDKLMAEYEMWKRGE